MLQMPPDTESMIDVILPVQTLFIPVIIEGNGLTVNIAVTKQPAVDVKKIVTKPAATPVTLPRPSTIAIVLSDDDHEPEGEASDSNVAEPTQTAAVPVITEGVAFTVIG